MQNKISRRQFLQVTGASAAALLLAGLPVEASAASGHLTVTPDTLVSDLRADPTFAASGVWTWQSAVDSPDTPEAGTTLSDYVGANMAQDSADALNYLADTYEAGTQVTYKVYSPEEIAADATRDGVELYYWPSEVPGSKFVVVMSGNVLNKTSNMSEGYATAWRLHQMGYAAFVLRYRVFLKAKDNAPVADLGNAVRFITTHAGQFNVQPENYALLGYSPAAIWPVCSPATNWATSTMGCPSPVLCCWAIPSTISLSISRSIMLPSTPLCWRAGTMN